MSNTTPIESVWAKKGNKENGPVLIKAWTVDIADDALVLADPNLGHTLIVELAVPLKSEITKLVGVDDQPGGLHEKYFVIHDEVGSVAIILQDLDAGSYTPPAHGADRAITATYGLGALSFELLEIIVAALNADSKFSATQATPETNEAFVTCIAPGHRTDAADGDTGFTITVHQQGTDAIIDSFSGLVTGAQYALVNNTGHALTIEAGANIIIRLGNAGAGSNTDLELAVEESCHIAALSATKATII